MRETHAFTFTGSGKEYFRIWIVNLCLSVATLGVYSAWAKVRRLQYFDRNTCLAGAVFDFCGDPKAILKGRLFALVLVLAYHYAFGFSLEVGIAIVATLLLAAPLLMRSALRFRLRNSLYRGLRFNFAGTAPGAYGAYLPVMLLFVLPGLLVALDANPHVVALSWLMYLFWPLMHGAMKCYQHGYLAYGAQQASFSARRRHFFKPYLLALLLGLGGILAIVALILVLTSAIKLWGGGGAHTDLLMLKAMHVLSLVASVYLIYLLVGPYLAVGIYNLAWNHTAFPRVQTHSSMKAGSFIALQTANVILTLATLGLYRPFAVVRTYRYRLAHMSVHTQGSLELILAGAAPRKVGAGGDGAVDLLGVDLSW